MSPIIWVISYDSFRSKSSFRYLSSESGSLVSNWHVVRKFGPSRCRTESMNFGPESRTSVRPFKFEPWTRLDNIRIKISNSGGQSCRKWSNWYYINVAFDWLTLWQILEDSSNFFFPKFEFFVSENPIDFRKTSQCEFHEHLLNFL